VIFNRKGILVGGVENSMTNRHLTEPKIYFIKNAKIQLLDFPTEGWVLDVGGGGEGIIGLLKKHSVISIDTKKSELEEAPGGPLKILMNAADLKFLDETFATAAMFFSLMFISEKEHQRVIQELYRVLIPGGVVRVWDAELQTRGNNKEAYVGIHINVNVAGQEVTTIYGKNWPDHALTCDYYTTIAKSCGFTVRVEQVETSWFYMIWEKPRHNLLKS
jgi:ubiquinone/menaquinone biosynthesis C-methylase UbiE